MPEGKTTAQRLFLLSASLVLGGFGWFLMGESEGSSQVPVTNAIAWVGGDAITTEDVHRLAAEELRVVEAQRREILSTAIRLEVETRLLAAEAENLGLSPDQVLQQEVEDRLPVVTADEIVAFRHRHEKEIASVPESEIASVPESEIEEAVREKILATYRQEARQTFFDRLAIEHQVQIQSEWIGRAGPVGSLGRSEPRPSTD